MHSVILPLDLYIKGNIMDRPFFKIAVLPALILGSLSTYAATPVDLSKQPASFMTKHALMLAAINVKETSRATDFNQTLHIRIKQTYQGHNVWGAEGVIHLPYANHSAVLSDVLTSTTTMNGMLYQDINKDLANISSIALSPGQAEKTMQQAINTYQQKNGMTAELSDKKSELIVYIDKNNKAHWAYHVSFKTLPVKMGAMPEKPVLLMDAQTFQVYEQWNDIKTLDDVPGGGFGGNTKMGRFVYDGLTGNLAKLNVQRDADAKVCYLENKDVKVLDKSQNNLIMSYSCNTTDVTHGNIYWSADHDAVNGAFSPSNDALYAGMVIKDMYQNWYKIPVLKTSTGEPMKLVMVVHEVGLENAYWDGVQMTFGDGGSMLYPLTSLGVAAHEISHGFTLNNIRI